MSNSLTSFLKLLTSMHLAMVLTHDSGSDSRKNILIPYPFMRFLQSQKLSFVYQNNFADNCPDDTDFANEYFEFIGLDWTSYLVLRHKHFFTKTQMPLSQIDCRHCIELYFL